MTETNFIIQCDSNWAIVPQVPTCSRCTEMQLHINDLEESNEVLRKQVDELQKIVNDAYAAPKGVIERLQKVYASQM